MSISDLTDIKTYIGQDSRRYAIITVTRIFDRVQLLIEKPLLGRMVPEIGNKKIRELREGHYRIIYRISDKQKVIEILRIFHDARSLKKRNLK